MTENRNYRRDDIETVREAMAYHERERDALADGVSHFAGLYHYAAKHTYPSDTCPHAACKAARGLLANRKQHVHAYWGMANCITCGANRAPAEEA